MLTKYRNHYNTAFQKMQVKFSPTVQPSAKTPKQAVQVYLRQTGLALLVWAERPQSRRHELRQQRSACTAGGLRPDGCTVVYFLHPQISKTDMQVYLRQTGLAFLVWAERPQSRRHKLRQQRSACTAGGLRPDGCTVTPLSSSARHPRKPRPARRTQSASTGRGPCLS